MSFSQILNTYRTYMKLTQNEVTTFIRSSCDDYKTINVISYHRWESGKVTPNQKKQAAILSALGLSKCVKKITIPERKHMNDYIINKYSANKYPSYIPYSNEYGHDLSTEYWSPITTFPNFLLEMQKLAFNIDDSRAYLQNLLDLSDDSALYVYFNKNNIITGHLLYFSLKATHIENMIPTLSKLAPAANPNKDNVLFVACEFAISKQLFSKNFSKIIDFLLYNINIKFVYIRCYDPELSKALVKSTSCLVVSKNRYWTGLYIESTRLKLLYSAFNKPTCSHIKDCDVRRCYDH